MTDREAQEARARNQPDDKWSWFEILSQHMRQYAQAPADQPNRSLAVAVSLVWAAFAERVFRMVTSFPGRARRGTQLPGSRTTVGCP